MLGLKPPVPRIPPKPIPRRLPERKRMTIAAGFTCKNGLVLCADTEYTGSIRQRGPKVWIKDTGDHSRFTVALAGAGDAALIRLVRNRLFERVSATATEREVETVLEGVLKSVFEDHIDKAPREAVNNGYDVSVLVGVRVGARRVLLEHSRTAVAWVDGYSCTGAGAPVANYIAETFFRRNMSMQEAIPLACYLLRQAKTFGVMCGGDSHVLTIPFVGPAEFVPFQTIKKLENKRPRVREVQ